MSRLPPRPRSAGRSAGPAAFTLVELLVAATLALVVMAALVSLFGIFGRAVADSQDLVQLGARMRSAAWRLRQDLQGVTTEVKPFIRPESANGYFELIEGPLVDTGTITTIAADVDDILMLTTASPGRPFTGLLSGTVSLESPVAEVAWFCKQAPPTADGLQLYNLYRRQLLVSGAPGAGALTKTNTTAIPLAGTVIGTGTYYAWDAFFQSNDLSVRREGDTLIANSLADLTRRHARFMHNVCGVTYTVPFGSNALAYNAPTGAVQQTLPYSWPQITTTSTIPGASDVLLGLREGEDLLLANVIAFDVRVFDPAQPGGGAYVDLGSGTGTGPTATLLSSTNNVALSGAGALSFSAARSQVTSPLTLGSSTSLIRMVLNLKAPGPPWYRFYDTSSMHTECNGVNDVVDSTTAKMRYYGDRGTNWEDGLDYAGTGPTSGFNGVVDDAGELEQPPPYAVPLRGVEIRIRCYEPSSQEVRQITIQHSFLAR